MVVQRARAELVGASAVWARVAMMHRVYTLSGHGYATVVDESGSTPNPLRMLYPAKQSYCVHVRWNSGVDVIARKTSNSAAW